MKKLTALLLFSFLFFNLQAQVADNTFAAKVNGKDFNAKAQRLKIPWAGGHVNYLALAGMNVNPDVQLWLRFYYIDKLKPGTYDIISQDDSDKRYKSTQSGDAWVWVDYTEETSSLGSAFHDGESMTGTVTITKVTDTSIEGTFDGKLRGRNYKKGALSVLSGFNIRRNLEDKAITQAGGGMLVKGDPHDHDGCSKKNEKTDDVVISDGKFNVSWTN